MPVGWGEVPFSSLLSAYLNSYSGLIIMELRNRYFGNLQESKTNLGRILNSLSPESADRPEPVPHPAPSAM